MITMVITKVMMQLYLDKAVKEVVKKLTILWATIKPVDPFLYYIKFLHRFLSIANLPTKYIPNKMDGLCNGKEVRDIQRTLFSQF